MAFPLINTEAAVRELVEALYSAKRKIPVIVVTQRADKEGPVIGGPKLQELLGPMAKVFTLSGGVQKFYNRALENTYGIVNGVRMYMPQMTRQDYPNKHPYWNEARVAEQSADDFMAMLHSMCVKRIESQKTHLNTQKLLTMEQANALFQSAKAPREKLTTTRTVDPGAEVKDRSGRRKVLHVKTTKKRKYERPSDDSIIALMRKFQK